MIASATSWFADRRGFLPAEQPSSRPDAKKAGKASRPPASRRYHHMQEVRVTLLAETVVVDADAALTVTVTVPPSGKTRPKLPVP